MSQTIAIYLRVSSKSQDVASQEPELRRWAAQQEGDIRWYRDRFTGKTMERPAFTRLLRHVRVGEVQQVAVWRLDRLGRTAKGLTALFDELTELNVRLVSLRDGLDLSTAAGRLMANVLASVAAYETEVRAERILAGQAAARAKGKTWGGSEKGRRIKVNDEQIRLIHRMKAKGDKVAAIARATGLSRPTIYDVLKTESALQKN
ncbi:MAG: recombinase family protein [Rubripirellula sp.]|jgi:DNA invertase Pin-like site-specific DNA recombinase|nr:recombinase family protein [Rubripirellula sp.]